MCRRDTGQGERRIDRAGVEFWLHKLKDDAGYYSVPEINDMKMINELDPDILNNVYSFLLSGLTLSDSHRKSLLKRGFTDDEINFRGYKTLNARGRKKLVDRLIEKFGIDICFSVPGVYKKTGEDKSWFSFAGPTGIVIPSRDFKGRVVALKIRRNDGGEGPKYLYVSSKKHGGAGPGAPVHVPKFKYSKEITKVRITEGELKADLATSISGILTLSLPGVTAWRQVLPVLKKIDVQTVLLALDADAKENFSVASALRNIASALIDEGYQILIEYWDMAHGKGIDDLLAAGKTPQIVNEKDIEAFLKQTLESAALKNNIPLNRIDETQNEPQKAVSIGFTLTDLGNAQRLVYRDGKDLRYCYLWGKWLTWNGVTWGQDQTGEILRRAKDTVKAIYTEASQIDDDERRRDIVKHALKSESNLRIRAMVSLAESESEIPITPQQLDADEWLLNCQNGTVDLKNGILRQHRRGDFITKTIPVEYNAQAQCPLWFAFLNRIMDGNENLIEFLQVAIGYTITGNTGEQALFFCHGSGANGKSVFLSTIKALMGDYAQTTPTETLMAKKNGNYSGTCFLATPNKGTESPL